MARAQKFTKSAKTHKPSHKTANALGYAKRHSLKSKATTSSLSDVYEHQQEKVRREKVKLQLAKDELIEFGGGEDGSEDEDAAHTRGGEKQPRLVGEHDDDSGIEEDEDEEIDSDAAFEESDEERYAGFSFSNNVRMPLFSWYSAHMFNIEKWQEQV